MTSVIDELYSEMLNGPLNLGWIAALGCATPAEMRKLESRVRALEGGTGRSGAGRDRVAEMGAEIEELKQTVDGLNGRLDVADNRQ